MILVSRISQDQRMKNMLDCMHGPIASTFDYYSGKVHKAHGTIRASGWTTVEYLNREKPDAPNVNDITIDSSKLTQFSSYNMFRQTQPFEPREDAWMEFPIPGTDLEYVLYRMTRLPYGYTDLMVHNMWIEQPSAEQLQQVDA